MSQKLIMCRGCQGSGKSFWAKEYLKNNRNTIRVNNDELRLQFFNRVFDEKDTKAINFARETLIENFLEDGYSVIVDCMNLADKHESHYKSMAERYGCEFEIKDFTNVPLETCIERDSKRENPIGKKIITQTYNKYIRKEPPKIEYDPKLPDAYMFDMDSTLSLMCDRSPYDESKCINDLVNEPVKRILKILKEKGFQIIICSGRDHGRGFTSTVQWLEKHDIQYDQIYLRNKNDIRPDDVIKEEIYNNNIKGKYNILGVFDDRLKVKRLWFRLGIPLFGVGDPDSDF